MSRKKQKDEELPLSNSDQFLSLDFSALNDDTIDSSLSCEKMVEQNENLNRYVGINGSDPRQNVTVNDSAANDADPNINRLSRITGTPSGKQNLKTEYVQNKAEQKLEMKSKDNYERGRCGECECAFESDMPIENILKSCVDPSAGSCQKETERFQSLPSDFSIIPSPTHVTENDSESLLPSLLPSNIPELCASNSLPNDSDLSLIECDTYDKMAASHSGTGMFMMVEKDQIESSVKRKNATLPRSSDDVRDVEFNEPSDNWLRRTVSGLSSNGEEKTDKEGIKTKLMSAWNNMRHGWTVKTKTAFKLGSPIWLLGKMYDIQDKEWDEDLNKQKATIPAFEEFRRDFVSRLWFTYRRGFEPFPGTDMTTDTGWGCMIRSGQMLIAQGLICHKLGRDWKWHKKQASQQDIYHRHIIKFFFDSPSDQCPLSVHNLVRIGRKHSKNVGDWYGPGSMAHVLRDAMREGTVANPLLTDITIYVAQDCTIYKQDVIELCTRRSNSSTSNYNSPRSSPSSRAPFWKPLIIIVPMRLGTNSFNTKYTPCVQAILASDFSIGIIGGKPKHSLYFIGWQDDKLIYMDPHFCQGSIDVNTPISAFPLNSFHCMSPRKLSFSKMDPSCAIGFYCGSSQDFEQFCLELPKLISPPLDTGVYPMFVISEGCSTDMHVVSPTTTKDTKFTSVDHRKRLHDRTESKESEDFVFL